MTAKQTREETKKMDINEKWAFYTEIENWTYIPDPTTWSGGVWYRKDRGSVNQQGGAFSNITTAVDAMDRHYIAMEQMERRA